MSVELERERTYLIKTLPDNLSAENSVLIRDIYVPANVAHAHLRVRQRGGVYEATKKIPLDDDPSHQYEHTIPLSKDEFEALVTCSDKSLQKRRYFTIIDGYRAEVDVYEEKLAGLVVVDFEFENEQQFDAFKQPQIVLADVTQDELVGGGFLAGKSYEDIVKGLETYGYEKIKGQTS